MDIKRRVINNPVGKEVFELRIRLAMNTTEFARELGVRYNTLLQWKTGTGRPNRTNRRKIELYRQRVFQKEV